MNDKLYLGIDWHKNTSAWVAINEDREVVWERKKVPCTVEEVQKAYHSLPKYKTIQAAIEPVCGWRWVTEELERLGVAMKIANPLKLRQIAESSKKTDRQDAFALADVLRGGLLPESYMCSDDIFDLRKIARTRAYLVSLRTGVKCRIHALCTQKGLHVTSERPLTKDGRDLLSKQGDMVILQMFQTLDDLSRQITALESYMKEAIDRNDTMHLLMTMPGIGVISTISIFAEVGDFSRFPHHKALISYAGLNPRERSSGERQRLGRISKQGSSLLRYTMVEAALRVRDVDASCNLYSFYRHLRETNKKPPMVARVALARKMLSCLWYMVHRNQPYIDTLLTSAQRRDDPAHVT